MISEDEVMRLLERADPVRERGAAPAVDSVSYLDALRTRHSNVTTIATTPTPIRRPSRHRKPIITIIGAAAAVVVLIVAGALVLTTRDDELPRVAARPPTTAGQRATAFLEAYWAFDADRALSYLTDDALARGWRTAKEFRLSLSFFRAVGAKALNIDCGQQSKSASGIRIGCAYDAQMLGSDEIGLGPYSGNSWDLTIRHGKIVGIERRTHEALTSGFSEQIWEPFARWVAAEHPDDVLKMYTDATQTGWRISNKSIPLWKQYTRDYVGSRAAYVGRGLIGLPPEGAPPSSPESGELVVASRSHLPSGDRGDGWVYVYADGRVIWSHWDGGWSGVLERRLTPEGVELVRAEVISSGLFDTDQPSPHCSISYIQVRLGDGLVCSPPIPPRAIPPEGSSEYYQLNQRLSQLQSWLPAGAWADPEIRAYVPSKYAVCMGPEEPSAILALLPAPAAELLAGARQSPSGGPCFDLTTDDAREVANALDAAGIEHHNEEDVPLIYVIDAPAPGSTTIGIGYAPYLPHGEQAACCAG